MGAATGDVVTGYFSSPEHGGWQRAIYVWALWAFAGAAVSALLWNATARRVSVLPTAFPKVIGIATLLLAAAAVWQGQQPMALQLATLAAAACLLGVFATRWAAIPAMAIAVAGLLTVFLSYAQVGGTVAWHEATAMVAYGLTLVTAIMILVEKKGE
jgi:hypothetical protein